jgi:PAS domain S-box-containing protein
MTVNRALSRLSSPRAVATVVGALAIAAALDRLLRNWDHSDAFLVAFGIAIAAAAGAVGGVGAGIVAAAGAWGLNWIFAADRSLPTLLALPAWLATGALAGWVATRLRAAASEREREVGEAREQLADSDARYRALTQSVPVATYVQVPERPGRVFLGEWIERLTGYAASDFGHDPDLFLRLVHDDDRERMEAELAPTLERGDPARSEYRLLARDGRLVWVEDEAVSVRDAEGRSLCLQGWLIDISERRRLDDDRRQLRAAESAANAEALEWRRKMDFLAKAAGLLASSHDYVDTITRAATLAVHEVVDWCVVDRLEHDGTLTRIVAEPTEDTALPEPEIDVRDVLARRRPNLTQSSVVLPLTSHGGRTLGALTLLVDERRRPFDADDLSWIGAFSGMLGLAIDSARLHDEVEARAEADRVLSYVGDGVFLLDRGDAIRLWNPMAEAITGLSADQVLGRAIGEAVSGWDQIADRVPIGAAREPPAAETLPLETERGERWISISGVAFFGGTVYAFRDTTDAHRLDELQAEFIATASHELRTPLAAVYGAAQTLRRHDFALDEAGRERFISLIVDESERLGRIVNQILLANQLELGRLDLEAEAFEAPELLERVAEATRTHLPSRLSLHVTVGEAVSPVAADKDHVRQILINLVENAIKYSPDGGRIELGVEAIEGSALFHVFDEGIGIPTEEQPRVFEKFYRLDPNMTRGIGGTGLGLYICSELVERMGGRIWVESRDTPGSAFYFELPTVGATRRPTRPREATGVERAGT